MRLSITSTPVANPLFLQNPAAVDLEKLQIAKAEFKRLESAGIVCHSKSPWASPLHMVTKKDRSWGPCGNYRHHNLVTTPDKHCKTSKTFPTSYMVVQ
jgi:hypothetical protein